jgi:hypothetical protein
MTVSHFALRQMSEPGVPGSSLKLRLARSAALLLLAGWSACGSAQKNAPPAGGEGGGEETGGSATGGATGGSKGGAGSGGKGGGGSGGSGGGMDASAPVEPDAGGPSPDLGTGDVAQGTPADSGSGTAGDAPPAATRPEAGQPCATGGNYNFTIKNFMSQNGKFTAFFTANPGPPPTNSVIGLSDGMKYLHDNFAAIVRFAENGNLDVRNGAAYMTMTPIKYANIDYHFRLVIDIPGKKYSAYVTPAGMAEVPMGIDMAFRDSAGAVNMMNYWGVEAIAGHTTRVCGFAVAP